MKKNKVKGSNGNIKNKAFLKKIQKMSNTELDSLLDKDKPFNILGIRFLERGFARNIAYYNLAFSDDGQKASVEISKIFLNVFSLMMFILILKMVCKKLNTFSLPTIN